MSRATPQMRDLAERLIAHEARDNKSSAKKSTASFSVFEKLRPPLAALVGSTGFSALLSRALALARPEVPWLSAVHVEADGSLEGLAELEAQVDAEKVAEGRVALLAQLIGLLNAMIGEHLTMQIMREVWPKLLFDELSFASGDGNENEK